MTTEGRQEDTHFCCSENEGRSGKGKKMDSPLELSETQSFRPVRPASGFQGGSVVKNLPANAGDMSSVPGSGRCPGEVNGNPFLYSCLGNPMDEEPGGLQSTESPKSRT